MSWADLATPPGRVGAAVSDGTLVYLALTDGSSFYSYDPDTDTYTQLADSPWSAWSIPLIADGVGFLWLMNDWSTGAIARYEIATDTWTTTYTTDPTGGAAYFAAVLLGREVYCAGGYGGPTLDVLRKYDLDADTWTTLTPMPSAFAEIRGVLYADGTGNNLLCFGGWDDDASDYVPTQLRYNVPTDTWSTDPTPAFSVDTAGYPMAVAYDATSPGDSSEHIAVLGGFGNDRSKEAWSYSPSGASWAAIDDLPDDFGYAYGDSVDGVLYAWRDASPAAGVRLAPPAPLVPSTAPVRVFHFADGEYPDGESNLLRPLSVTFDDPLPDLGGATVTLKSNDPDALDIAPEDVLSIYLVADDDSLAWCGDMIVDDDLLIEFDPAEENGETVTYSGPLMMGELKDGLIEPPGGTDHFPSVDDLVYDFTHIDYIEGGEWVPATEVATVEAVSQPNGWAPFQSWTDASGDPVMPFGSPTWVLWASDGTIFDAGSGLIPARATFTTSFDGVHYVQWTGDNSVQAWLDGKDLGAATLSNDDALVAYHNLNRALVSMSPGEHTIALLGENYVPPGGFHNNPGGIAAQVWIPGPPGLEFLSVLVWESTGSVNIVEYPAEIPGMTPSNVMRLWLESQQALGRFLDWTLDCTDTMTSAVPGGDPETWSVLPTISVRVGEDDGLSLTFKIIEAYADVRIGPGKVIRMYNKDAFTQSSGVTFERGNLTSLQQHRVRKTGDEGLVKSQLGWTRVGSGGRRQVFIPLGPENNPAEVARLGTAAVSVSSVAPEGRVLAYRPRNDSEKPYINPAFVPGSTGVVPTRGGGTAEDRLMRIGFRWAQDEELVIEVTVKNIILQDQERVTRAIKAAAG